MASFDEVAIPRIGELFKTKLDEYKIVRLLGKGGYGAVFEASRGSDQLHYAVKCEAAKARKKVLLIDLDVLCGAVYINSKHFCTPIDRGHVKNRFNFLVMTLVGKNLWDLRVERPHMRYTLGTAVKLAHQTMVAIEELHRLGILHRDIKPGNYAMGRPGTRDCHTVYILDFGLCRAYTDMQRGKDLRRPRNVAPYRGTTRYASRAAQHEIEQSRKDDLEGWLFMVVEWTGYGLPWRKMTRDEKMLVLQMKEELVVSEKAREEFLRGCPKMEYFAILMHIFELRYTQIPDYGYLSYCLHQIEKRYRITRDTPLDWDPSTPYQGPIEEPGSGEPAVDLPAPPITRRVETELEPTKEEGQEQNEPSNNTGQR